MPPRDPAELAKRFASYADAITAFAILQNFGFISILVGHDFGPKRDGVIAFLTKILFVLFLLYPVALAFCYTAEDQLLGKLDKTVVSDRLTNRLRNLRHIIIGGSFAIAFGAVYYLV